MSSPRSMASLAYTRYFTSSSKVFDSTTSSISFIVFVPFLLILQYNTFNTESQALLKTRNPQHSVECRGYLQAHTPCKVPANGCSVNSLNFIRGAASIPSLLIKSPYVVLLLQSVPKRLEAVLLSYPCAYGDSCWRSRHSSREQARDTQQRT